MKMPDSFTTNIKISLKRAGIIINNHSPAALEFAESLEGWLKKQNIQCIRNSVTPELDILITLGGDGTLLRIAEQAARYSIPVVGVNLGNLGFLTELSENEAAPALEQLLSGNEINVENRMMLKACLADHKGNQLSEYRYALNEVVINKNTLDRLLSLDTSSNGDIITSYKADGLIFSTATGSTAYSLSAGGPLVHPGLMAILVTPICPFMLSSRPMMLPGNHQVTTTFSQDCNNEIGRIIIDGQEAWEMGPDHTLIVEKAEHPLQLIAASSRSYFQVLRNKLHWGGRGCSAK